MTTTFRADEGLAFLLQYENVAWYDAGEVRILDRRVYPAKTEFVTCRTHGEVAQAIRDMVSGLGSRGASKAPGKLGKWLPKPFQTSSRAVSKSGSAGRRGRSKLPL